MATPLSDLISALVANATPENWDKFEEALVTSHLGVVVTGLPADASGTLIAKNDELAVARTMRDGKLLLLTCADFEVFCERYPELSFNAEMDALSVFRTALSDPACEGILVNSAASQHSVPVQRARLAELMSQQATN